MHPYGTDSTDVDKIRWVCLVLGVVAAYLLAISLSYLNINLWWLDLPSVVGFYSLFFYWFDSYLWKSGFVRGVLFLNTPIVAGKWKGRTRSSYQDKVSNVELEIDQTLTKMNLLFDASKSKGRSMIASLLLDDGGSKVLCYEYLNEPKPNAVDSMHPHRGYSRLEIKSETSLEGEYFSGRDRQNYGSIFLEKEK